MNWETAKSWLIVVFFVLDLLLGWQYVQSRQETQGYVESRSDIVANTKTLLAEHNFSLKATIPQQHPDLASIRAQIYQVPLDTLAKNVFPDTQIFNFDTKTDTATSVRGKVKVNQPGTWTVTFNSPQSAAQVQDVLKLVWNGSNYKIDPTLTNNQKTWVFDQSFQGLPMYNAPLVVQRSGNNISRYQQTMYHKPQPVGSPKPIISALDALNSLANTVDKSMEPQDNVIEEIDLGYACKTPSAVTNSTVSSNYWFPVWRIVTLNNIYYVNAFTGEVETQ